MAAVLAGCTDAPSRQAETPAAREKAAAAWVQGGAQAKASVAAAPLPRRAEASKGKAQPKSGRAERSSDDLVYVTVTTTISDAPERTADNGGSNALPVRRPGQREGVFAVPLAVSGLEDPTVF
ncbi:hypothetical protein [Sphingomonas sp. LHG3406-1]|uniref:hypothetical protein n=1 Tax=Sphingomonas sp. LHG3406-1 TaxID=2804617 RepID=UPI00263895CA|nr:hypothetical protein [Sphingomonas sp. LHG3406-1]